MDLLSRLRLRTKLSTLVTIPLLAMFFFASTQLIRDYRLQADMEGLTRLTGLAAALSALIHETQKERGASAGFTGSQGKKFVDILPKQHKLTDQRLQELNALLQRFDAGRFGREFEGALNNLLKVMKQLPSIRQQVSALSLPLPKVVGWYTNTNATLLTVVERMPHQISDAELIARVSAYANYLQSKERVGIERAVLSATFGADRFAPGMYRKFIQLVAAQNNFMHAFQALADSDSLAFYHQAMKHESVTAVEKMRATAMEKAVSGGFGVDAEHWFKAITLKINQLKQVDDHLAAGILDMAEDRYSDASMDMGLYLLLVITMLVVTVVLSLLVAGSIREPMRKMSAMLDRVASEGDFSLRMEIEQQDSIGVASRALDQLLSTLQVAIRESNRVVGDVARGKFHSRVESDFTGELEQLRQGVNGSAESVQHTMEVLQQVMGAIRDGNFGYRLEGVEMEGGFRQVLEQAMETMDGVIGDINQVMERVANGRFDARVTVTAAGDLDRLKQSLNRSLDTLEEALKEVIRVTHLIGEGDLRSEIKGNYSGALELLKEAVSTTQVNFSGIVARVRAASQQVRSSSEEISRGSMDLSSRTSEQAASLEETAASMEQMASTVNMNSDSASHASQLAAESLVRAKEGNRVVSEAVTAMAGINDSSSKIAEIIGLIDGIAFQTNLLALNAAVEAARAGDHGRGFSVVAGEVRSLAQRSADAAKEIKRLIEDSTDRIRQGGELVERSGNALASIEESVKKMNDITAEIESATKEQTQGINQVNTAVSQLDSATQENAALVEETASSSAHLSSQADELSEMVSLFKLGQQGEEMVRRLGSAGQSGFEVIARARAEHLAWKGKIRGFLSGMVELDGGEGLGYEHCSLERWLSQEGRAQFGQMPELRALEQGHKDFHALLQQIVSVKESGDGEQAEALYLKLDPLTMALVEQLNQLEAHASSQRRKAVAGQQAAVRTSPAGASAQQRKPTQRQTPPSPSGLPHTSGGDDEWTEF